MKSAQDKKDESKSDKAISNRHLFTNIVNERNRTLKEDLDMLNKISKITTHINNKNSLFSKEKPKLKCNIENVDVSKLNISEQQKQKLLKKIIHNIIATGSPDDPEPMNNLLFSQLFLAEDISEKNIIQVNPSILNKKHKLMTEMEPFIIPEFDKQSIQLTDENTSYRLQNITITIVGVGTALLVGYLMMPAGVLLAAQTGASALMAQTTAAATATEIATTAATAALTTEKILKTTKAAMDFAKSKMETARTFQYLDPVGSLADLHSASADFEEARTVHNEEIKKYSELAESQKGTYSATETSYSDASKKLAESSTEIAEALLGIPGTFSIMVKVYTVISSAKQGRTIKESLEIMLKTGARESIKFGVTYVVGAYTTSPQNAKQLEKLKTYISGNFPTRVTNLIDSAGNFIGTNYHTASTKLGEYVDASSAFISSSKVGEFLGRTKDTLASLLPESVKETREPAAEVVTWLFGYMRSSAIIYATNTGLEGAMNNIEFLKATTREKQILKKDQENLRLMEKQQEFMDFEFEMENGFMPTSRVLKNLYSDCKIKIDELTKKHPYIATMMILITANFASKWICDTFINNAEGVFRGGAGYLPYGYDRSVNNLISFVKDTKLIKTDAVRAQIQRMIFPYLARVVNDILPLKKIIMEQVQKKLNLKPDEFITIDKVVKRELTVMMVMKNIVYLLTKTSTDIIQEGFIMNSMILTKADLEKYTNKMEHWYINYVPTNVKSVIENSIKTAKGIIPDKSHSFLTHFSNFFWSSNNSDAFNKLAASLSKAHNGDSDDPGFSNNGLFPEITPEIPIQPKKAEPNPEQAPPINIGTATTKPTEPIKYPAFPDVSVADAMGEIIGAAGEAAREPTLAGGKKSVINDVEATELKNIKSELKQKEEEIQAHIFQNDASIKTLNTHILDNEKNLQTKTNMLSTDIKASITEEITRLKSVRDNLVIQNKSYRDFLQRIRSRDFLPGVALSSTYKTDFIILKSWFDNISRNDLYHIPQGPLQFDSTHLPKLFNDGATHYAAYTALKDASPDPKTFREYSTAAAGEVPFASIPIDRIKEQTQVFQQHKIYLDQLKKTQEQIDTLNTEVNKHPVSAEDSGVLCGDVTCVTLLRQQKESLAKMTEELDTLKSNLDSAVTNNLNALFTGKPLPKDQVSFKSLFSFFKSGTVHKNISVTPAGIISFVPGSQTQLTNYDKLMNWYTELKKDEKGIASLSSYLDKNKPTTLNDLFNGLIKNNNPKDPKLSKPDKLSANTDLDTKLTDFKLAIDKMKNFDEQFGKTSKNLTDTKHKTEQAHHTATGVHNEVSNMAGDSKEQRGKRGETRDILSSAITQAQNINKLPGTLTSIQTNFDAQITALFTDIEKGNSLTGNLKKIDTKHSALTILDSRITNIDTEVDKINSKLLIEANKGIFGIQPKEESQGPKEESQGPKEESQGPKEEPEGPKQEQKLTEPVTLEGLQLYLRTKTANRLQFFLKNKNMLTNSVSEKFKDLLSLLTPEALQQKQEQALSIEEQQIIDLAHQDILDNLTGDDPRHNRTITAILNDFNLPKLNIHSLGQILSLGKDQVHSQATGGAIGATLQAGERLASKFAFSGLGADSAIDSISDSILFNKIVADNPLTKVYASTYQTMNTYLNLGEGVLQEQARNMQLTIQRIQLEEQQRKDITSDIKERISDASKNFLHWGKDGIGFLGKDGTVKPILIEDLPLPIVGEFNIAKLLLANGISGGGASLRKALFEAYDVKGEGTVFNLWNKNWDKAIKMFNIAKKYALTSPELTPVLFGDGFKLTPKEVMNEVQISAARVGTYFAPTGDVKVEMNKIARAIMDWDMGQIAELCIGKIISKNISFLCRHAYKPGIGARRSWESWQYDYDGYLAGKYDKKKV
jgi:hypothetical protein